MIHPTPWAPAQKLFRGSRNKKRIYVMSNMKRHGPYCPPPHCRRSCSILFKAHCFKSNLFNIFLVDLFKFEWTSTCLIFIYNCTCLFLYFSAIECDLYSGVHRILLWGQKKIIIVCVPSSDSGHATGFLYTCLVEPLVDLCINLVGYGNQFWVPVLCLFFWRTRLKYCVFFTIFYV